MMDAERRLAPALGWFGITLGALEMVTPKTVARAIGTNDGAMLVRAFGAREIGAGFAVLSRRRPAAGLWMRVAGNALDLAALALAMRDERNDRSRLRTAMAAVAAVTAVDAYAALATGSSPQNRPAISKSVAFMASMEDLMNVLREPSWMRRCVPGLANATVVVNRPIDAASPLHYVISGGGRLAGSIRITLSDLGFDRGTMLRLELLSPNVRIRGRALRVLGELPGDALAVGLHRLKNIVEVGEVISNDGPSGRKEEKKVRA